MALEYTGFWAGTKRLVVGIAGYVVNCYFDDVEDFQSEPEELLEPDGLMDSSRDLLEDSDEDVRDTTRLLNKFETLDDFLVKPEKNAED